MAAGAVDDDVGVAEGGEGGRLLQVDDHVAAGAAGDADAHAGRVVEGGDGAAAEEAGAADDDDVVGGGP